MQAARGTSVGPGGTTTAPPRRGRLRWLFAAVAAGLYTLDVTTKILAVEGLTDRDVQVIGEVLQLHLTRNPGAAFSTGTQFTVVLTCVAIVAVGVVLWLSRRLGSSLGWAVALGALLAGISGNLTDRILRDPGPFRGHVIDFLMLPNWPVFNVADICINIGAGLVLVQAFRGIRIDGSRERRHTSDERSGEQSGEQSGAEPEPERAE